MRHEHRVRDTRVTSDKQPRDSVLGRSCIYFYGRSVLAINSGDGSVLWLHGP